MYRNESPGKNTGKAPDSPIRKMVDIKVMAEKSPSVPEGLRCHRLWAERVSTHVYTPRRPGSNLVHTYLVSCTEGILWLHGLSAVTEDGCCGWRCGVVGILSHVYPWD